MKLNRNIAPWAVIAAFCALLFVGSVLRLDCADVRLTRLIQGRDKLLHGVAYAVLAVLTCRALPSLVRSAWVCLCLGVIFTVSYGALLEGVQATLAARSCSWADVAANTLGATAGSLVWMRVLALERRRTLNHSDRVDATQT